MLRTFILFKGREINVYSENARTMMFNAEDVKFLQNGSCAGAFNPKDICKIGDGIPAISLAALSIQCAKGTSMHRAFISAANDEVKHHEALHTIRKLQIQMEEYRVALATLQNCAAGKVVAQPLENKLGARLSDILGHRELPTLSGENKHVPGPNWDNLGDIPALHDILSDKFEPNDESMLRDFFSSKSSDKTEPTRSAEPPRITKSSTKPTGRASFDARFPCRSRAIPTSSIDARAQAAALAWIKTHVPRDSISVYYADYREAVERPLNKTNFDKVVLDAGYVIRGDITKYWRAR